MRLIGADALMELARNHIGMSVDCNDIARFPTIDAEPVRHGRWEGVWNGGWESQQMHCTICKKAIKYTDGFLHGFPKYCPNCGAKMDGDQK